MKKSKSNDVQYRRGIVLGLTFAELLILLMFVVMLVLGASLKKEKDSTSKKSYSEEELIEMDSITSLLKDKRKESYDAASKHIKLGDKDKAYEKLMGLTIKEPVSESDLRGLASVVALIKSKDSASFEKIREHLQLGESEKAYQLIVEASPMLKNHLKDNKLHISAINDCRAQNKHLVNLKNVGGRGGDFPSCWSDENGSTQYLYNITLTDNGILVSDNLIPSREMDKANLPLKGFKFGRPMKPDEFMKAGYQIKKYSDDNSCRFFVRISDKTSANSKELYKKHKSSVENIFYKKDV